MEDLFGLAEKTANGFIDWQFGHEGSIRLIDINKQKTELQTRVIFALVEQEQANKKKSLKNTIAILAAFGWCLLVLFSF